MEYIIVEKVIDDFGDYYYKVIMILDSYKLAERFASQLCDLETICLWVDGCARFHFCDYFNVPFAEYDEDLQVEF